MIESRAHFLSASPDQVWPTNGSNGTTPHTNGNGNGHHPQRPTLSIVVPTRNEAAGIERLVDRICSSTTVPTELIFVDDSDDVTAFRIGRLTEKVNAAGLGISLVHRTGGRRAGGLGTAVRDGIERAQGTWVCVLDADLQHPPEVVPTLLERAMSVDVDVVIGSRYSDNGQEQGMSAVRRGVSRGSSVVARALFPMRLRSVKDPLSGLFLLRRSSVNTDDLRPQGFKILLEILARNPQLRTAEVGYEFTERYAGVSKASIREGVRYLRQLTNLRFTGGRHGQTRRELSWYDIHGIITVASERPLPELKRFRVRYPIAKPTVNVRIKHFESRGAGGTVESSADVPHIRYEEIVGSRGFMAEVEAGETVNVLVSPFIARSPHVLYTNIVEPILRWSFVSRGYALVHAAAFESDGKAYLVTARTDTGKTTTMLKVLQKGQVSFLSDDLSLVDPSGRVLTYPKPLTISNHTVGALGETDLNRIEELFLPLQSRLHSKTGRQFALKLAEKHVPVASLNTLVQRLIPPPKYRVDKVVPAAATSNEAQLTEMFVIQRGDDFEHELDSVEALDLLLENCEDAYGFPPYASIEAVMLATSSEDLRAKERDIITKAFDGCASWLIGSSSMGWAEVIADHLEIDHIDLRVPSDQREFVIDG